MQIKHSGGMGRGVFSTKDYVRNEVIEECPVIIISPRERIKIDGTSLYNYYYSWGKNNDQAAIALGYGSLYNHSYNPNAQYVKDLENATLKIVAIRSIATGEEIRVNYNGDPSSKKSMWFRVEDEG